MTNGLAKLEVLLQMNDRLTGPLRNVNNRINRMNGGMQQYAQRNKRAFNSMATSAEAPFRKIESGFNRVKPLPGQFDRANTRAFRSVNRSASVFDTMRRRGNRAFSSLSRGYTNLTQKARRFGRQNIEMLDSVIPGMGRLGGLLTNPAVLGGAAIVGTQGFATAKAAGFEDTFLKLRQLNLDKERGQLNQLRGDILGEVRNQGLASPGQFSGAVYDIQSGLGLFGDENIDLVKEVAEFGRAFQIELPDAINSTVKAMRSYDLEANQIDKLLESQVKTVQVGVTTFQELATVQAEYLGVAASANQSLDAANKIFAAFSATQKNVDIAANLTKTFFQGLTEEKTRKGLEEIGVSMFNANEEMRGMDDILRDLVPKINEMSGEEFTRFKNAVGGPEGLRELFNQLSKNGDAILKTFQAFDETDVNIDKAIRNADENVMTLWSDVKNKLNAAFIEFGTNTLPMVADALNSLNDNFESVSTFFGNWHNLVRTMSPTSSDFWPVQAYNKFIQGEAWDDAPNRESVLSEFRFKNSDPFRQLFNEMMPNKDFTSSSESDMRKVAEQFSSNFTMTEGNLPFQQELALKDTASPLAEQLGLDFAERLRKFFPDAFDFQQSGSSSSTDPLLQNMKQYQAMQQGGGAGGGGAGGSTTDVSSDSLRSVITGGERTKNVIVNISEWMPDFQVNVQQIQTEEDIDDAVDLVREAFIRTIRNYEQAQ